MTLHRLAYLCADRGIPVDGSKGASVHFRELGRALRRQGIELDPVLVRGGNRSDDELSARVAALPPSTGGIDRELDTICDNGAVFAALSERAPHDAVYERYSLFGLAGAAYARRHDIPLLLEMNSPLWIEAARYRGLGRPELARAVFREVTDVAAQILVVSDALGEMLVSEGADSTRIKVFPNGVAPAFLEDAAVATRPRVLRDKKLLLFAGSLKPWHGIEFLLEAFERNRSKHDLGLWIVGTGPLAARVESAAVRLPDRIVYEGAVEHERMPSLLRSADIVVAPYMPDSPGYFCPLKAVEALATSTPLLASDLPFVREVVGEDGAALFEPGDHDAFHRALATLLDDETRSLSLVRRGHARVRERFTWELRAREIEDMLDRACRGVAGSTGQSVAVSTAQGAVRGAAPTRGGAS